MVRRAPRPECRTIVRWLLLAGVVACGLGGREVSAATVKAGGIYGSDDHARHCKCRSCDPKSCCCGPRKAKPAPAPVRTTPRPAASPSPCMKSSPCGGDQGLPTTPVVGTAKAATLDAPWGLLPVTGTRHLPASTPCVLPARRAARLDEPPEPTARG